jgi:hypothetical protein
MELIAKLGWLFLGIFIKWLLPGGNAWDTRWGKDYRAKRHRRQIDRLLSQTQGQLRFGALIIRDLAAVQLFEPPLTDTDVQCSFRPQAKPFPEDIQDLESSYLPQRAENLRRQGKTVDFNELYGLRGVSIARPDETGRRANRPRLTFEPTNFRYYLMCNEVLDRPLLLDRAGGMVTIRQRHLERYSPLDWAKISDIPIHMWFGTVTAVITADNQLIVALRSGMQAIVDGTGHGVWRGAMSAAEGMFRPADSVVTNTLEEPSPFQTSSRALRDELGLELGSHFTTDAIELLGIGFDSKRFQPVGVFAVKLPSASFVDVLEAWNTAKDRHEQCALVPIPTASDELARLLLGKQLYQDKPIELFSNQQKIGALLTSLNIVGAPALASALKRNAD